MKKRWETKKIDEVCQFINGLWKGEEPPFINIGVFRNTNFTKDGNLDDTDIAYLDVELKKFEKRQLMYGDIILEKSGGGPKQPVGRVALFDKKKGRFSFSNFTAAMRVNDPKILDFRFLHKFLFWTHLSGATENMQNHSTGIRNLNSSAYKNIELPLPPLPEQRRIVGILDEAFDAIAKAKANAEKNLQNARELFESHLNEVFTKRGKGWVEKRLGDVSRINYGYTESASAEKIGPHFLRITDIQDNRVHWGSVPYCSIDSKDYPKYKLMNGDIVFARTGATTGKSYLVIDPPNAVFASYLIRVQLVDKELHPSFVNRFFQTQTYWNTIRAGVSGSAQGGFNATKLGELMITFPISPREQCATVERLNTLEDQTQHLESIYQRKLAALDELKKSLLHQAFSGAL